MMLPFKPVILATDALVYILLIAVISFGLWARSQEHWRAPWRQVMQKRLGIISMTVLAVYIGIGLLDSIHFRIALPGHGSNGSVHYQAKVTSLLDVLLGPLGEQEEKTYSAPFATHLYNKTTVELPDGCMLRTYPALKYGGADLKRLGRSEWQDILYRISVASFKALSVWLLFCGLFMLYLAHRWHQSFRKTAKQIIHHKTAVPWRVFFITVGVLLLLGFWAFTLAAEYHIFGTDKVGQDVFYAALKSIRTGLLIGTLTTLVMLPFALLLGTMAGYFGGLIDDVIQYIYTTLSSIPGVLLIAASILALQVYISQHPQLFSSNLARADARLLALCVILGVTSWTALCRLLRGETLKLREMDYIQAARTLGVGHWRIITRHIMPNVMHIVLISVVLDFSGLVLAEAVLSYVGVGVDPTTLSWGNMINAARLELAREPIVWWPLLAAFIFMFTLVLAANLFSDSVRDAFDPRIRVG